MNITFLPIPRKLIFQPGCFTPKPGKLIHIQHSHPQRLLFSAEQIKTSFIFHQKVSYQLTARQGLSEEYIGIKLTIDSGVIKHPQAYHLSISPERILITGADETGVFYGTQTLKQIISQSGGKPLPCLEINDWPDFQVRGVMLDISRDKVYQMETLMMLVDELSSWKINQLQLYVEHTFAYRGHELVWANASPLIPEEILFLDRYCQERFIELVPNQNSFGHMSRWLVHPPYAHLAETTEAVPNPWGGIQVEPFSLSPVLPESIAFVSGLYDQLLPNFSSRMVNVGCDETFDIGLGRSKQAVEKLGKGQVYLDYLLSLYDNLKERGYTMQFWGDIVLEHPELISKLPKDVTALNWGYEADHPFETECKLFRETGIAFYVCPGTSSWNSLAGRTDNMLENSRQAAVYGLKHGAMGFLNTDWGDNGHWQQLPISYPGLAFGAAQAWCVSINENLNLSEVLNKVVFLDESGSVGSLLLEIGNLYKAWGLILPNSSPLFWMLKETNENLRQFDFKNNALIEASLNDLSEKLLILKCIKFNRHDGELIKAELTLTLQMLQLACKRALMLFDVQPRHDEVDILYEINVIIEMFSTIWHQRNRPGGLSDSLARFKNLTNEFSAHG